MKTYYKILIILFIPLVLILCYGLSNSKLPNEEYALEKMDFGKYTKYKLQIQNWINEKMRGQNEMESILNESDSVLTEADEPSETPLDSTKQIILFFGDSMLEGLSRRLCDYAMENDYELHTICWYSSTSEIWAKSDTLNYFINKYQPTYIMICLCSNEQFVKDLPKRAEYIDEIIARLGKLPYIWIAPPSWKEDTGINQLINERVGDKRFYDSTKLEFVRGRDHVHPTFRSAESWMDSIAVWLQSQATLHPIVMNPPSVKRNRKWDSILLMPI